MVSLEIKLKNGGYVLGGNGLPEAVSGKEELLQNALLRLTLPRGSFPYGRQLGSGLSLLDVTKEHAGERALALANEALLDMPGVRAEQVEIREDGSVKFLLSTPLGEGEVIYGAA